MSYLSAKRSGERATWFCSLVQIVISPIVASIRRFSPVKKIVGPAGFSSAERLALSRYFLARKSRYVYDKYRLLHGKCARTVFTHELLAY